MGLIEFVKDAGDELAVRLGLAGASAEQPAVEAGPPEVNTDELSQSIAALGLEVDDLGIEVEGDQAIVTGTALSQADREKAVLVVGNTKGVAQVDDQFTVENPEPEATYYKVVAGDTLSKIAKREYGDPMLYNKLFQANQPMLENPDKIYPGQVLRIPPLA